MKAIISGGGTGGHIFPAVAIANAIKARYADADILFIGAEGRMEMEKVPAAGYPIKGLPIAGLQRSLSPKNIIKNLAVPFKLLKSQRMAKKIIRDFNPDIVVGVGGYASAPTLKTAANMGYPTLLQEQNSYPGLTNKMLSAHADIICVAYNGLEKFFPAEKIVFTGNPVRKVIEDMSVTKAEGCATFQVNPDKRIILSVGGSLGARTINETLCANLKYFIDNDIQLIWQTGKGYYKQAKEAVEAAGAANVKVCEFIRRNHLSRRRHLHLGAVSRGQARDTDTFAQRGRRPSDQKRHGTGKQRCRPHGTRRRSHDRPLPNTRQPCRR